MSADLYEFRDYHYDRDRWDEYREWWGPALEILRRRLDVVGLWFDSGNEPRIAGSEPMDLPHGSANVTWILRWDDIDQREAQWDALWDDAEWSEHWDKHPGIDGYLHMSVRFLNRA